jgi:hypothetical protein
LQVRRCSRRGSYTRRRDHLQGLRLAARHGQLKRRHGRDKEPREIERGWERAIDKAFDLKDWR